MAICTVAASEGSPQHFCPRQSQGWYCAICVLHTVHVSACVRMNLLLWLWDVWKRRKKQKTRDQTHKLSLQLALTAAGRLALDYIPGAVVRAHVQVVVCRDALAEVGGSRPEVGKGRLGARAGLGAPTVLLLVFALHVILQTPQLPWRREDGTDRKGTNDEIRVEEKKEKGKRREGHRERDMSTRQIGQMIFVSTTQLLQTHSINYKLWTVIH